MPTTSLSLRLHELAYRTQYAELKERVLAAGPLLPGTPGSLARRSGTGQDYCYRVYYAVPGKQVEEFVGRSDDQDAIAAMRERMAFSAWVGEQVGKLRKLGFQVADKAVARVLVELHNLGTFDAGLTLVGTLAVMAWANEFGIATVSARTQDIDLARRQSLKLAMPLSFMKTMQATGLPFSAVPGMPSRSLPTSIKLAGVQGLRVDLLAPGPKLGAIVRLPELEWCAQAVPHYDYMLAEPEPAALLAGGHCIPVRLPQPARMVWHKLYTSTQRKGFPEKAAKDRQQALILATALADENPDALHAAWQAAEPTMLKPVRALLPNLMARTALPPELVSMLDDCLAI